MEVWLQRPKIVAVGRHEDDRGADQADGRDDPGDEPSPVEGGGEEQRVDPHVVTGVVNFGACQTTRRSNVQVNGCSTPAGVWCSSRRLVSSAKPGNSATSPSGSYRLVGRPEQWSGPSAAKVPTTTAEASAARRVAR